MQPKRIDQRYRVIRTLGRGMSGEVFLVEDEDGVKALKLLNAVQLNISRADALAGFKNEFAILKNLNHPNIAAISDFGYEENLRKYYYTCELVEGATLEDACRGRTLPEIEKFVVQVLRAINYLHARGVYHFDLKPQNILVHRPGEDDESVKVIDFGLAGYRSPGKIVGTPAYMAPEVIEKGPMDGRTDLYALGVIFYKILTGKNPFATGKTKPTQENHLRLAPPPPSFLNPQLPPYWDHIIGRLLEKNPVHRYSQASLVIRDLNFLSGKSFAVETEDTKLSYLPKSGTLIGREDAWQSFARLFERHLESEEGGNGLLIVEGGRGSGKTRLLSEIKAHCQLRNVAVTTAAEFARWDRVTKSFSLFLDDASATPSQVNELLQQTADLPCLIVWAAEKAPEKWSGCVRVRLENYTTLQMKQYLESVTGLAKTPPALIAEVYRRTQGNPLLVTEFVSSLLKQGLFYDESGKWDAHAFEDIEIDFDKIGLPVNAEDHLSRQLDGLSSDERAILNALSVNGASLDPIRLHDVAVVPQIEKALLRLIQSEIIDKVPGKNAYDFRNPLVAGIVEKRLSPAEKRACHERLAIALAADPEEGARRLFHLSFGCDRFAACDALRSLGQIHLDEAAYDKAASVYERLHALTLGFEERSSVADTLKWGEALVRLGKADEAERLFTGLLADLNERGGQADQVVSVYIALLDAVFKQGDQGRLDEALSKVERHCGAAERELARVSDKTAWGLILRNARAFVLFKRGRIDDAQNVFEETHAIWRDDPDSGRQNRILNNRLIDVYHAKRDFEKAAAVGLEYLEVWRKTGNRYQVALSLYHLGNSLHGLLKQKDGAEAAALSEKCAGYFKRCEEIAREMKNYPLMLRAFNGLGILAVAANDIDKALEYYGRALTVSRQCGEAETAAFLAYNISTIHKSRDNSREAYGFLIYAINTFENLSVKSAAAELTLFMAYLTLCDVQLLSRDADAAEESVDRAEAMALNDSAAAQYVALVSLRRAKIRFALKDPVTGRKYLAEARSLARTPEQENVITKYEEGLKRDERMRSLREATDLSQSTSAGPERDAAYRGVIDLLRRFRRETGPTGVLRAALNAGAELLQTEYAAALKPLSEDAAASSVDQGRNAWPESWSDEDGIRDALASAVVVHRNMAELPEEESGKLDFYEVSALPLQDGKGERWSLAFVRKGEPAPASVRESEAYLLEVIRDETEIALRDLVLKVRRPIADG